MVGSVRAKMASNGWQERGDRGALMHMTVVYEGREALQKISENSIFGNATPSGSLYLYGDFPVERFKIGSDNEYYIDIYPVGTLPSDDCLFSFDARLQFQSRPTPPNTNVSFRYVPKNEVSGSLDLGIHNPDAIDWLAAHDDVVIVLRDALGKKSDEEIALREKHLEEAMEQAGKNYDTYHGKGYYENQTREQHIQAMTASYRKKLSRARGEIPS